MKESALLAAWGRSGRSCRSNQGTRKWGTASDQDGSPEAGECCARRESCWTPQCKRDVTAQLCARAGIKDALLPAERGLAASGERCCSDQEKEKCCSQEPGKGGSRPHHWASPWLAKPHLIIATDAPIPTRAHTNCLPFGLPGPPRL